MGCYAITGHQQLCLMPDLEADGMPRLFACLRQSFAPSHERESSAYHMPACQADMVEEGNTLLITRESQEYGNVFHMLTDLFNAYLAMRMLGWDSADSSRSPRVVLLDNHPAGHLDGMWAGVVARGGSPGLQHPWNSSNTAGAHTASLVMRGV